MGKKDQAIADYKKNLELPDDPKGRRTVEERLKELEGAWN